MPPATFLPDQLDRIRTTEFGSLEEVVRDFRGGFETVQGETTGFRFRDVDLADGVLYTHRAVKHLRPRLHRLPAFRVPEIVTSGALYETWMGNRWFGNWLMDDCASYRLAERYGSPVTAAPCRWPHVPDYEARLGIQPRRITGAHFDELILFNDSAHNADRRARAKDLRNRLVGTVPRDAHAGVFLLRGNSGASRILSNEVEIAETLALKHGFRVVDPLTASVAEIIDACAGARVVAGVEGSHLVHGTVVMPAGAALLVIQPPERVTSVLKIPTDLCGQRYAFVVGTAARGQRGQFSVAWDVIDRTLGLLA